MCSETDLHEIEEEKEEEEKKSKSFILFIYMRKGRGAKKNLFSAIIIFN